MNPNTSSNTPATSTVATIAPAVSTKLAEINGLAQKMQALQTEVEAERQNVLVNLHTQLGYQTPSDFIQAYQSATSGRHASNSRTNGGKKSSANGRKPRAQIDDSRRKEIIAFFKGHGSTVDAMQKFDISLATAQNLKKDAGMVKARK